MLDSGASHNVMPKIIMDKLGLQITRPYGNLYSFDSRRVKCMGLIKDLVVTLAQVPVKSILMDVVIADIPPKYGMLLSRSWGSNLGGSLQLDMMYATIPVFSGQFTRLYRETRLAYIVSDPQNPNNFPIYIADQDLGNCILFFMMVWMVVWKKSIQSEKSQVTWQRICVTPGFGKCILMVLYLLKGRVQEWF